MKKKIIYIFFLIIIIIEGFILFKYWPLIEINIINVDLERRVDLELSKINYQTLEKEMVLFFTNYLSKSTNIEALFAVFEINPISKMPKIFQNIPNIALFFGSSWQILWCLNVMKTKPFYNHLSMMEKMYLFYREMFISCQMKLTIINRSLAYLATPLGWIVNWVTKNVLKLEKNWKLHDFIISYSFIPSADLREKCHKVVFKTIKVVLINHVFFLLLNFQIKPAVLLWMIEQLTREDSIEKYPVLSKYIWLSLLKSSSIILC